MSTATCPLCGETYLAAATVCADCRVALVLDPPEGGPQGAAGGLDASVGDAPVGDAPVGDAPVGDAPAPLAWPDGEEEVGYELDDWGEEDRDALTAALEAERVPYEWHDGEIVVPERWADVTEELIDALDHPDALDPQDAADDGGAELLGALYVAGDILSGDPTSSAAVVELLELAPTMEGRAAPYGVDERTWWAVGDHVAQLAALLEGDADSENVKRVASALRGVLQDLV